MKLTEADIRTHTFYGEYPRVCAFTWEDGPEGVNYQIEGVCSIDGLYTDKASFVEMANGTGTGILLAVNDVKAAGEPPEWHVVNPEAQTDDQAEFLRTLRGM